MWYFLADLSKFGRQACPLKTKQYRADSRRFKSSGYFHLATCRCQAWLAKYMMTQDDMGKMASTSIADFRPILSIKKPAGRGLARLPKYSRETIHEISSCVRVIGSPGHGKNIYKRVL